MRRTEIIRVLKKAEDVVKAGWCQGTLAADSAGDRVSVHDLAAAKFCVVGAINRVTLSRSIRSRVQKELRLALKLLPDTMMSNWNDVHGRKQADVVAAFRRARRQLLAR